MIKHLAILSLCCLPLSAAAAQSDEGPPRWAANIVRKQQVIMHGLPRAYRSVRDPLPDTPAKLQRGRMIFERNCSSCHGWNGQGGGPGAFALVPAPADLEWLRNTPKQRADPYIYWTISEGGREFESDMPAFKGKLSKSDIWSVIAYIRAGLPRATP
jgi:mono/diheme cytochrome c family protein